MYARILVPIDDSDCAQMILREVGDIARSPEQRVLLMHVSEPTRGTNVLYPEGSVGDLIQQATKTDGGAVLNQATNALRRFGVTFEVVLGESRGQSIAQVIVEQAISWKAEVIVMGTRARWGFKRMLRGSVARKVVRMAPVPVLIVRCQPRKVVFSSVSPRAASGAP
jgi:nucleotide-binding universal stress UspA family protein